jgi:hypothetical protein
MRRKAVLLFILFFLVLPRSALAQGTVVAQNETITKDYFATGSSVNISGTVNGDAFVAAGSVLVQGTINGDLLVAGGTVNVGGTVTGNIRAIGGQVIVSSQVGGNVTALGGAVNLTEGASISGSLVSIAGSATLLSPIGRGINAAAGQMTIGNTVGGDVSATVGQLTLAPGARISGNLTYVSSVDAQIQGGAQVSGTTTRNAPPPREPPQLPERPNVLEDIQAALVRFFAILRIIDFASALLIGLVLIYLLPIDTRGTVKMIREQPWKSLGIGLLFLIVLPIIVLILLGLVITIPLALIILALYFIALYLAKIFVAIFLGEWLLRVINRKAKIGWALLWGLVIYEILLFVPFIGGIVMFLVVLLGLGAIYLENRNFYQELRSKNLI